MRFQPTVQFSIFSFINQAAIWGRKPHGRAAILRRQHVERTSGHSVYPHMVELTNIRYQIIVGAAAAAAADVAAACYSWGKLGMSSLILQRTTLT
jgi:acyl-coenzyme A thioesterase PaaI-like protein